LNDKGCFLILTFFEMVWVEGKHAAVAALFFAMHRPMDAFDHDFLSPTYESVIKQSINNFINSSGGRI